MKCLFSFWLGGHSYILCFVFVGDKVSCSPVLPQTCYVTETSLEHLIFLLLKFRIHRQMPPHWLSLGVCLFFNLIFVVSEQIDPGEGHQGRGWLSSLKRDNDLCVGYLNIPSNRVLWYEYKISLQQAYVVTGYIWCHYMRGDWIIKAVTSSMG